MAQFNDTDTLEFVAGEAITKYLRVKLGVTERAILISGAGEATVGVVRAAVANGGQVGVVLANKVGTIPMVADAAIAINSVVYPAAAGKVSTVVAGTALGRWISTAATASGDIGEVLLG